MSNRRIVPGDQPGVQFISLELRHWNVSVKVVDLPLCPLGRLVVSAPAVVLPVAVAPVDAVTAAAAARINQGDVLVAVNDVHVGFLPFAAAERIVLSSITPPVLTFARHGAADRSSADVTVVQAATAKPAELLYEETAGRVCVWPLSVTLAAFEVAIPTPTGSVNVVSLPT